MSEEVIQKIFAVMREVYKDAVEFNFDLAEDFSREELGEFFRVYEEYGWK